MLIINMSLKEKLQKYNTPHHINMFIIYAGLILIVITISIINFVVVRKYGTKYTQSMYRPDEKPIQSIHVGPGLDKGYCASGNDGFHNSYRVKYKNKVRYSAVVYTV